MKFLSTQYQYDTVQNEEILELLLFLIIFDYFL